VGHADGIEFAGEPLRHDAAVAQHGDAIGDCHDVRQTVGNVEHRDAARLEGADDAEQRLALDRGEGAVGSSKITMRCGVSSARAICTIWRCAIDSRAMKMLRATDRSGASRIS